MAAEAEQQADAPRDPIRGLDLALELVNTVDMLEDPPDRLRTAAQLQRFLTLAGYTHAAERVTEEALGWVRELRDALTRALDASEDAAAALLNALSVETHAYARLSRIHGAWRLEHGAEENSGPRFLGAATVVPLQELLASGQWDRVARCAASPCCCAFVDRSPRRDRKYCCKLCADRVNQAKYRQRRTAER